VLNSGGEKRDGGEQGGEKKQRKEEMKKEEIAKEMQNEPSHPIILNPPVEDESPVKDTENKNLESGPSTPTDVTTIDDINVPILRSENPSDPIQLGLRFQSNILDLDESVMRDYSHHGVGDPMAFPFCVSPRVSVNNNSLPAYRRTNSNDSLNELGYGCTAFLGAGVHLFTEGDTQNENQLLNSPLEARTRSGSEGEHPPIQPAFTSSFDTVHLRTGLSCHRGSQNLSPISI